MTCIRRYTIVGAALRRPPESTKRIVPGGRRNGAPTGVLRVKRRYGLFVGLLLALLVGDAAAGLARGLAGGLALAAAAVLGAVAQIPGFDGLDMRHFGFLQIFSAYMIPERA